MEGKHMNKENIMYGIIGLLIGVIVAGFTAGQAVNNNRTGMMRMMGMDTHMQHEYDNSDHSTMSMAAMTKELENLSGEDYDKAFIEMMIAHHEGAIDMAKLSDDKAKHDEIKKISRDIIEAQDSEIAEMRQWQKDWGFSSAEMMQKMHGNH
jgi:uncharacterized protein (DUF305 family)